MTDHQIEDLRRQIAAYATICEQLVAMHKALAGSHHDSLAGLRMGSIYYDPSTTSKITGRQRWTPTPMQLQLLESIFDQGTGAPSKQKIKEITQKLSQISESNVYNWFQNRRARSKRKQTSTTQINSESEAEADLASLNEKMAKIVGVNPYEKLPRRLDNLTRPCSETSSEVSSTDQETNRAQNISTLNDNSNSCEMSFYENFLSNPRNNQLEFYCFSVRRKLHMKWCGSL